MMVLMIAIFIIGIALCCFAWGYGAGLRDRNAPPPKAFKIRLNTDRYSQTTVEVIKDADRNFILSIGTVKTSDPEFDEKLTALVSQAEDRVASLETVHSLIDA